MNDNAYFKSSAIGSSLLAAFIKGQDYAKMGVRPTGYMEAGKIWEDWLEEQMSDSSVFTDKYFFSKVDKFPETTNPMLKSVAEIVNCRNIKLAVLNGYVHKVGGDGLNGRYKARHDLLDDIRKNGFKRPIPRLLWDDMQMMFENFQKVRHQGLNLFDSLKGKSHWQQTHFWQTATGAKCRMKSDIETYFVSGKKYGELHDIKLTANIATFWRNWRSKYVWQAIHYLEGFKDFCEKNIITPPKYMWFIITEAVAPFLTRIITLSQKAQKILLPQYHQHVTDCQTWIDAGKPAKGYIDTHIVDNFGRNVD